MRQGQQPRRRRSEVAVVELVETTRTEECSDRGMANSPTRQGSAENDKIVSQQLAQMCYNTKV